MTIKNFIKRLFEKWTYPLILFGICLLLFILSGFDNTRHQYFQNITYILFTISIVILIISSINQFTQKHWKKGILTIAMCIVWTIIGSFLFFIITTAVTLIEGDHWADDLKIPTDISIENPIDMDNNERPDSIYYLTKSQMDLKLYNSFQPGLYEFDFWMDNIDSGTIYLKAFEITQEDQLSADNLEKQSKITVVNTSDTLKRFGSIGTFTIYEGDWEKHYAARFEVWFKPTNDRPEKKLFEKNFKIEGWMH